MKHQTTISVIIRALNAAPYLSATLDMLQRQTVQPAEIIVIDLGSTDDSSAIARSYGAQLLQIRRNEFSYGFALNLGAAAARGDILVLLSGHATPCDTAWLQNLIAPFSDQRVAGVYSRLAPRPEQPVMQRLNTSLYFSLLPSVLRGPALSYHNRASAVRRRVWQEIPFDETMPAYADSDWARKARAATYRVVFAAQAAAWHAREELPSPAVQPEHRHVQEWPSLLRQQQFAHERQPVRSERAQR
jgi:rhamnosyltransferase